VLSRFLLRALRADLEARVPPLVLHASVAVRSLLGTTHVLESVRARACPRSRAQCRRGLGGGSCECGRPADIGRPRRPVARPASVQLRAAVRPV